MNKVKISITPLSQQLYYTLSLVVLLLWLDVNTNVFPSFSCCHLRKNGKEIDWVRQSTTTSTTTSTCSSSSCNNNHHPPKRVVDAFSISSFFGNRRKHGGVLLTNNRNTNNQQQQITAATGHDQQLQRRSRIEPEQNEGSLSTLTLSSTTCIESTNPAIRTTMGAGTTTTTTTNRSSNSIHVKDAPPNREDLIKNATPLLFMHQMNIQKKFYKKGKVDEKRSSSSSKSSLMGHSDGKGDNGHDGEDGKNGEDGNGGSNRNDNHKYNNSNDGDGDGANDDDGNRNSIEFVVENHYPTSRSPLFSNFQVQQPNSRRLENYIIEWKEERASEQIAENLVEQYSELAAERYIMEKEERKKKKQLEYYHHLAKARKVGGETQHQQHQKPKLNNVLEDSSKSSSILIPSINLTDDNQQQRSIHPKIVSDICSTIQLNKWKNEYLSDLEAQGVSNCELDYQLLEEHTDSDEIATVFEILDSLLVHTKVMNRENDNDEFIHEHDINQTMIIDSHLDDHSKDDDLKIVDIKGDTTTLAQHVDGEQSNDLMRKDAMKDDSKSDSLFAKIDKIIDKKVHSQNSVETVNSQAQSSMEFKSHQSNIAASNTKAIIDDIVDKGGEVKRLDGKSKNPNGIQRNQTHFAVINSYSHKGYGGTSDDADAESHTPGIIIGKKVHSHNSVETENSQAHSSMEFESQQSNIAAADTRAKGKVEKESLATKIDDGVAKDEVKSFGGKAPDDIQVNQTHLAVELDNRSSIPVFESNITNQSDTIYNEIDDRIGTKDDNYSEMKPDESFIENEDAFEDDDDLPEKFAVSKLQQRNGDEASIAENINRLGEEARIEDIEALNEDLYKTMENARNSGAIITKGQDRLLRVDIARNNMLINYLKQQHRAEMTHDPKDAYLAEEARRIVDEINQLPKDTDDILEYIIAEEERYAREKIMNKSAQDEVEDDSDLRPFLNMSAFNNSTDTSPRFTEEEDIMENIKKVAAAKYSSSDAYSQTNSKKGASEKFQLLSEDELIFRNIKRLAEESKEQLYAPRKAMETYSGNHEHPHPHEAQYQYEIFKEKIIPHDAMSEVMQNKEMKIASQDSPMRADEGIRAAEDLEEERQVKMKKNLEREHRITVEMQHIEESNIKDLEDLNADLYWSLAQAQQKGLTKDQQYILKRDIDMNNLQISRKKKMLRDDAIQSQKRQIDDVDKALEHKRRIREEAEVRRQQKLAEEHKFIEGKRLEAERKFIEKKRLEASKKKEMKRLAEEKRLKEQQKLMKKAIIAEESRHIEESRIADLESLNAELYYSLANSIKLGLSKDQQLIIRQDIENNRIQITIKQKLIERNLVQEAQIAEERRKAEQNDFAVYPSDSHLDAGMKYSPINQQSEKSQPKLEVKTTQVNNDGHDRGPHQQSMLQNEEDLKMKEQYRLQKESRILQGERIGEDARIADLEALNLDLERSLAQAEKMGLTDDQERIIKFDIQKNKTLLKWLKKEQDQSETVEHRQQSSSISPQMYSYTPIELTPEEEELHAKAKKQRRLAKLSGLNLGQRLIQEQILAEELRMLERSSKSDRRKDDVDIGNEYVENMNKIYSPAPQQDADAGCYNQISRDNNHNSNNNTMDEKTSKQKKLADSILRNLRNRNIMRDRHHHQHYDDDNNEQE
jgi:hypothetical protein